MTTKTKTPADEAAEEFSERDLEAEANRIFEEVAATDERSETPAAWGVDPFRKLHRKIAEVMLEVERIPKRGVAPAAMGGFSFVQVGDAAAKIRMELARRHVTLTPIAVELIRMVEHETRQSGGIMTTETYGVTWQFTDGETGETHTIQSVGTGADRGDKASPKAQTNAMKYALLMAFLMPTGDDPELEDSSDRHPKGSGSGQQINIDDSSATGVRQGGRQSQTTQAQVSEIARLARTLKLGPLALAAIIDQVLPEKPVPAFEDESTTRDKSKHILEHLNSLTHEETGEVIQVLMNATPAEPTDDTEA